MAQEEIEQMSNKDLLEHFEWNCSEPTFNNFSITQNIRVEILKRMNTAAVPPKSSYLIRGPRVIKKK